MKVTFTRTKTRGYSLKIEGPKIATAVMDPAPGYHHEWSKLPIGGSIALEWKGRKHKR